MASKLPTLSNQRALRTEILVDKTINSRKTTGTKDHEAKVKKLSESIKIQGLMHPPVLLRTSQAGKGYADAKQPYLLVAGFRRQEALDLLGQEEGDYRLAPADWTLADALAANMVENLAREDLSSYETATTCYVLATEHGKTKEEIGSMIRALDASDAEGERKSMSASHVENLIRMVKKLDTRIKKAWQEGHPKASIKTLLGICAIASHAGQWKEWSDVLEGKKKAKKTNGAEPKDPVKRPSVKVVGVMMARIKDSDKDATWKKGAIAALLWAAGTKETIPGIKLDAPAPDAGEGEGEDETEVDENPAGAE